MNDLGGTWTGEGKSSKAADEVVALIRANGGTAVANYGEIPSDWEDMLSSMSSVLCVIGL